MFLYNGDMKRRCEVLEVIMDSLMKCMDIVGSYNGILRVEELYASGERWMLKISAGDAEEKKVVKE